MNTTTLQLIGTAYDSTKEFWVSFKLPWCRGWPDSQYDGRVLAAKLMEEEFNELLAADFPIDELDAYCDLLYVTAGAMHSVGYERAFCFMEIEPGSFTGPLAESIKLIKEPGIVCHRRLQRALPAAIQGIVMAGIEAFPKMPQAFAAVHKANMSKLWSNRPDDMEGRTAERVIGGKWLVKRKEDGKVIKSPEFKHPDLTPYL